jgi:NADH:ubiquinone oxidoreductase subunit 4 (subunit M)
MLSKLFGEYLLTTMAFAPAAGALIIFIIPRLSNTAIKWIALAAAAVPAICIIPLLKGYDPNLAQWATSSSSRT